MALPKRKHSRARRNSRRAHQARRSPARSRCPRCAQVMLPHRVCENCGYYAGRQVVEVEGE
ncbi:MAG: 50S ribosomal protein L32 [Planctomycetes bacterium]|nr:50S ribosomal protein L32 [Planctomycetota bacterium]